MLELKGRQINAIASKRDLINTFLKNRDWSQIEEIEETEDVHIHEFDEDFEYCDKIEELHDNADNFEEKEVLENRKCCWCDLTFLNEI